MFESIKFIYPFREYQLRVLNEIEFHMRDGHVHVVAPPGSGKTVLGLEIMCRLGKPTLIFSPTRAIRDQWLDRFTNLFITESKANVNIDYVSTDIKNLNLVTSTTYQALNSIFSDKYDENQQVTELDEEENVYIESIEVSASEQEKRVELFIAKLKKSGIKTLILDEAHHLRNEWWKALIAIKSEIKDLKIVALTATPPYDSEKTEWDKYIELCGKIDVEIYVAELVKNGDLCPHQDYLVLNHITNIEKSELEKIESNIKEYIGILAKDQAFIDILLSNPCINKPMENIDKILGNPSYYSSIVLFLNSIGYFESVKSVAKLIGIDRSSMKFNASMLENMLQEYLFKDEYSKGLPHSKELITNFKRVGAIDNRTVNLTSPKKIENILRQSVGKYNSISNIVKSETEVIGQNLRMLILTDYIRKSVLLNENTNPESLGKLGVIPIFEYLRTTEIYGMKLAVLTGTIKIIHKDAIDMFMEIAKSEGIENISTEYLKNDSNYVEILVTESLSKKIVAIVTKLFEEGGINILIGTSSLLGEGWDAPCINSLILASTVSSYMLSNQMRGRAIRSYKNDVNKVSNIWHLVSLPVIDLSLQNIKNTIYENFFGENVVNYYYDIEKFERKSENIVGLNVKDELIENGIDRFELYDSEMALPNTKLKVEKYNNSTFTKSRDRESIKLVWKRAIDCAKDADMQEIIELRNDEKVKVFTYGDVLGYFVQILSCVMGVAIILFLNNLEIFYNILSLEISRTILICVFLYAFFVPTYNIIRIFVFAGDPKRIVKKVGRVVLNSLYYTGGIKTDVDEIAIKCQKLYNGSINCHIKNATTYEKNLFADTMKEVFDSIDNPRYIIKKENGIFGDIFTQIDYYSIPNIIGENKKYASYFYKEWIRHVSKGKLIYTRSIKGRQTLLKIRLKAVSGFIKNRRKKIWE